jgi:hypothetical protein
LLQPGQLEFLFREAKLYLRHLLACHVGPCG